ncbi:uncharacterized protein BDW47DRAFT_100416 [Aspergillus candidus]|uniref:Uncharacterized protein n=1 Tax=Aspergillus candidus TaxID=41067 RepID=A0A2I2FK84_ASPCN|nr:hypothetical protein BDW47DRAFT_100416 [Aspergillus candidus]PLB41048.1 hypothetical protein BDW47DRAFT_100416 [Aspergillus candidus]
MVNNSFLSLTSPLRGTAPALRGCSVPFSFVSFFFPFFSPSLFFFLLSFPSFSIFIFYFSLDNGVDHALYYGFAVFSG